MIYFKNSGDVLEKYKIVFNEDKVKEIHDNVKYKCGTMKHVHYFSDYGPFDLDMTLVRNWSCKYTGRDKEYDTEIRGIDEYEYDLIEPPELAYYIKELLAGSPKAYDSIRAYPIKTEEELDEEINQLNDKFLKIKVTDIEERRELLDQIKELLDTRENKLLLINYYKELMDSINLELIDTISMAEINRVSEFFESSLLERPKNITLVRSLENKSNR